jgi:hypothetical protein
MPKVRVWFVLVVAGLSAGCAAAPATTTPPSPTIAATSSASPIASPTASPTAPADLPAPSPGPAWQTILAAIGDDGTVSKDTALQAFSLAIGPLPGVSVPAGDTGMMQSGSMAVRWLVSHWQEISAEQQQAAIGMLPELGELQAYAPEVVLAAQNRTNDYYTQLAREKFAEIGANLQSPLNIGLTINARVGLPVKASSAAETGVYNAQGGFSGTPAKCVIVVSAWLDRRGDADVEASITHETWHCYEGAIVGLARYWSDNPASWIIEGEAEWVAATLNPDAPMMAQPWPFYLGYPGDPLFSQSYQAIGFYSQLDSSGTDPWTTLADILKAPDNASAFAAAGADSDAFLDRWASGFLRDDSRGDPWQITGPAVTSDKAPLNGISLNNGGSVGVSVPAYANEVSEFGETPDVMQVAMSGHARVSDANGHDYLVGGEADFCMLLTGCECPGSDDPPPLPLEGAAVVLAVTGGAAGSAGTLIGTQLDDFCNKGVSGTWTGTWTNSPDFGTPAANGGFTMTVRQKGATFTGTVSVTGPTCVRTGTVNGTVTAGNVQFGWVTEVARPVQFEGTFSKNAMSGTWNAIACEPANIPIYGSWDAVRTGK